MDLAKKVCQRADGRLANYKVANKFKKVISRKQEAGISERLTRGVVCLFVQFEIIIKNG